MSVEIKVPTVGESITEGTIARWLKADGDLVRADEPLFELETDKATMEVPAPADGKLSISVAAGQTVAVGAVVGRIETSDGAIRPNRGQQPAGEKPRAAEPALSPAARRLARRQGIDIRHLAGAVGGERITEADVRNYLETRPAEQEPPADREGEAAAPRPPTAAGETSPRATTAAAERRLHRQPMSGIRQRIARRLVESQQTTATLTTFNEADLSAVIELRQRFQDRFREKHGVGLGFMSFFVKACVEALREFPVVNARIDGSDIVYQHFFDIGVAVSTERGLMVPVVRDADRLTFAQVEKRIAELARKAREGKIAIEDLQGGTFTITNGGVFGSLLSTPILNPPQSAILGMHAIHKRPVVVADQVVVRPMMYLALSYDHRLIDGREAVLFLLRVKEYIEAPARLLLEV
jgi:2-oxoglutarate dehydrogenase E2 component (dihydrolipoamide succinyltransferase)